MITRGSALNGDASEIGAGGMAIRCMGILEVSQPVELAFELPEGPAIRVSAVVWWKKDGVVGFRFDLAAAERVLIEGWVEQRLEGAKYFSKPI